MNKDKEIQENAIKMRYLEGQANAVQQQMLALEQSIIEISTALNALEEMKGITGKKDSLIPLGAGVFTHCSVDKTEKVLIDIGSGVVVEKTVSDAIEDLSSRKDEAMNSIKTFEGMLTAIQKQYSESGERIQELRG